MSNSFNSVFNIAHSGLAAQSHRLQIIAENIANARVAGARPGDDPYQRKTLAFNTEIDRATGDRLLKTRTLEHGRAKFTLEFDPRHPAADAKGYVKMPNVNQYIEIADMKEANRSYLANLQTIRSARELYAATIDLLKA